MERRVVLCLPLAGDAVLAQRVLHSGSIESVVSASTAQLIPTLEEGASALLIAEEALTEATGAALARYLERQPTWSDLPILLMTKRGADSAEAQRAFAQLGNVTLLERPVRTITLISAVRSALKARDRQYQMRAAERRKDEFIAALAHELRNPLAPIRNAMSLLERMDPQPQVRRLTSMVERQVRHLTRLVDDLLDVARITNGKLELQLGPTSVSRVVQHALEIANAEIEKKQHQVRTTLPEIDVPLRADHVRLVQGLANLLVNAAKFTPAGGSITLAAAVNAGTAEFRVRDSGRGLSPAELERIFGMFEQARRDGEPTGGLGLGLHLTRAFAQMHGGTVRAHSEGLGKGSEFVLRIPLAGVAA